MLKRTVVRAWRRVARVSRALAPAYASLQSEAPTLIASAVLAACVLWAFDVVTWPSVRKPVPLLVSSALGLADGAVTGIALVVLLWLPLRALTRLGRVGKVAPFVAATAIGLVAARQAVTSSVAGAGVARYAALAAVACVGAVFVLVVGRGFSLSVRPVSRDEVRRPAMALAALGVFLLVMDRTKLSSTGEAAYSYVEAAGHLTVALAIALLLRVRARSAGKMVPETIALLALFWLVLFGAVRPIRLGIERSLPAVWEEPVYASRWLRRVRRIDAAVFDRGGSNRLAAKYEVSLTAGVDDAWMTSGVGNPPAVIVEPPAQPWNVVVFFVDALRADVAHDPEVMPETVAWMNEQSVSFSRAYATGSSTLLTLAPMLGCRYDSMPNDKLLMLDVAGAAGMKRALFIPKTPSHYHRGAFPSFFVFDHEDVVDDFDGSRIPTAETIVDRSLAWLRDERPERFLLWVYNFDAHGWSDLEEGYVERHVAAGHFSKTKGVHYRYRAAARGIDQAFTKLRHGLDELGLTERTVVLFFSDHGEALGHRDFWAHSTYLWESLIRVPLAFHVPGEPARRLDHAVSTIDISPTLAPFVGARSAMKACHGEDLLADEETPRRSPILFSAMVDGDVARIGMLARPDRKLVLDLRDADARLLRIRDGSWVEEDVSFEESDDLKQLLDQLVRAPIYPRQQR